MYIFKKIFSFKKNKYCLEKIQNQIYTTDLKMSQSTDDEYIVEKILAKYTRKGTPFYLIKWKGYSKYVLKIIIIIII